MAGRSNREPPFFRWREEKRRANHAAAAKDCDSAAADQPKRVPPRNRDREQVWLFEQAKDRLAAANEAIHTTRTFFLALLSIAAYIGVVVWGTTDEQLLRISPVTLPIVNVKVPLTGFYTFVPWMFVLLHFNLLIHLGLTSQKLKGFLDDLKPLDVDLSQRLRRDVANFPLAQWMVGHNDVVFRVVLTVLVWILLVLLPPFLLLWMQLRFLAYQDETITSLQAAAVALDALLIIGFHAWFVRQIEPQTRWLAYAKALGKRRGPSLILWVLPLLTKPLLRYLIPLIPLAISVHLSTALSTVMSDERIKNCASHQDSAASDVPSLLRSWYCGQYHLDLGDRLLTKGTPSPEVENTLRRADPGQREESVQRVLGLDLEGRHLVKARFAGALLPRANLRTSDLRDAYLFSAQIDQADLTLAKLQRSNLTDACLVNAKLFAADLRAALLFGANLQNADLSAANLRFASLGLSNLQSADLSRANLEHADLAGANLQNADLSEALLQNAELEGANLQRACLSRARVTDVDLSSADLQGADLFMAQLARSNLTGANLRGASLDWANATSANLYRVNLRDADLSSADFQDAFLHSARLDNARLLRTNLRGSVLQLARLDNAWLAVAQLQTTNLIEAKFWGAVLEQADLAWADLTDADLSFANLNGVKNLETTELAGADYVFADGLEGTILDINQPPPDVLPAP